MKFLCTLEIQKSFPKVTNNLKNKTLPLFYISILFKKDKLLTKQICTVNSTPMPTDTMSITAGTADNFRPIRPINPNSSTNIMANTTTYNYKLYLNPLKVQARGTFN